MWYIMQAVREERIKKLSERRKTKNFRKKFCKTVDFINRLWYYNQAVAKRRQKRCRTGSHKSHIDKDKFEKAFWSKNHSKQSIFTQSVMYWVNWTINMRVWFWLRTNAGGVLNTCKSNERSNTLVADGWVTREEPGSNRGITTGNSC